jgi:hypothetical protein
LVELEGRNGSPSQRKKARTGSAFVDRYQHTLLDLVIELPNGSNGQPPDRFREHVLSSNLDNAGGVACRSSEDRTEVKIMG